MSLFEISAEVRVIIKWIFISIGALFLLWLLFIGTKALIQALTPKKPVLPTTAFGKLPRPLSPNSSLVQVAIDLDTPDGTIPAAPSLLEVYPIPKPTGKINSLDLGATKARALGVDGIQKALSPTLYQWRDSDYPAMSVTIDIITGNYTFNYDWVADPKILPNSFDRDPLPASGPLAQNFFSRGYSGFNDFKTGETKSSYVRITGSERLNVSSPSEANSVEVSVYREKIKSKYSIVGVNPNQALMTALTIPENKANNSIQVVQASFTHWFIDFKNSSTYPLRSPNQAFEDLKSSKAYIVTGKLDGIEKIKINDISLAYLETENYSPYLQPIYVLKGSSSSGKTKSNFIAYVPAVSEDQLRSTP